MALGLSTSASTAKMQQKSFKIGNPILSPVFLKALLNWNIPSSSPTLVRGKMPNGKPF